MLSLQDVGFHSVEIYSVVELDNVDFLAVKVYVVQQDLHEDPGNTVGLEQAERCALLLVYFFVSFDNLVEQNLFFVV